MCYGGWERVVELKSGGAEERRKTVLYRPRYSEAEYRREGSRRWKEEVGEGGRYRQKERA